LTPPPRHRPVETIMTIRVLLVDDHLEVRERLQVLLHQEPHIELVGEAAGGAETLEIIQRLLVDVVVMDLNLPEISGIETARRILADRPDTKVVIVSLQSDPNYVKAGFKAGVTGYLLKDCAFEELVEAVHIVAAGGSYVSPEIEIGVP
jgi:DNA-binding NarL/FixJ family response regulator